MFLYFLVCGHSAGTEYMLWCGSAVNFFLKPMRREGGGQKHKIWGDFYSPGFILLLFFDGRASLFMYLIAVVKERILYSIGEIFEQKIERDDAWFLKLSPNHAPHTMCVYSMLLLVIPGHFLLLKKNKTRLYFLLPHCQGTIHEHQLTLRIDILWFWDTKFVSWNLEHSRM